MDMTEATNVSGMLDRQLGVGNGHSHAVTQREDSYQSAYEAGLARGKEEGYRRGYREGFSDCYKLSKSTRGTAATAETTTEASKKTASNRASRLRGLPCANCGSPSYSDEVQCPRCGTPREAAVGEQSSALEEPQSKSLPNVRSRRRHSNSTLTEAILSFAAKVSSGPILDSDK